MAATMKDIARRTGLGLATISSYFNGGNVREKNRVKIEEAIQELHYEVNEVARGLKTNATKTIGVVIPELNNTFCAEIITEMEDVLRSHGYATIVCDCRTDKKLERDAVEFLSRKRVDGIISMPVDAEGNHLKKFQKIGKPIVLIDRRIQELSCDSVLVDNEKAAEDAMRVFFKAGHRKIGIIGGPEGISTAQERLQGYRSAYEKENLPVRESLIYHGDYTIQGGVRGIEKLVADNPDMTAVFVCRVFDKVDLGTHICFYAEVEDCRTLSGQSVLTYGYYQTVKKGTTPKNAPSYKGGEDIKMAKIYYRCKVCGHVENVSELPEGYVCPVCGVGPEMFERVEEPEAAAAPAAEAKGYRCKVCGYVEHLAELPADYVCPVCGVGPEMFEKL